MEGPIAIGSHGTGAVLDAVPSGDGARSPRTDEIDLRLVVAFKAGDTTVFDLLYARHGPCVHRVARRLAARPSDADDIVQVVFERVWRNLHRFEPRARLSTWICKLAVNASLDSLKSRRVRRWFRASPHGLDDLPDVGPGPEDSVDAASRRRVVHEALRSVPTKYRVVLVLHEIEERPFVEIAEILDLPVSTLKMRAVRGREHLAKALRRMGVTHADP